MVLKELWDPYDTRSTRTFARSWSECLHRVVLAGLIVFILPNTVGEIATSFMLFDVLRRVQYIILDPYRHRSGTHVARGDVEHVFRAAGEGERWR